jgi:hypothetical protein
MWPFSSLLVDFASSATSPWEMESHTNSSPETSSPWLQEGGEFDATLAVPDLVVAGTTTSDISSAAVDASANAATALFHDLLATNMHDATALDMFDHPSTGCFESSVLAGTPPLSSIYGSMPDDSALMMFENTATNILEYTGSSTFGYTPTNTPLYMPSNTFGLTAVPTPDLTAMHLLADTAAYRREGTAGCQWDSTTTYPLKQGTIDAADSPTLGAYYTGTSDLSACSRSNWGFDDESQNQPYYASKCRQPEFPSPANV